jgi:hypothetical protein
MNGFGFGDKKFPGLPDHLHDLPEKLEDYKGQGNEDEDNGSQRKQGGQDILKKLSPVGGKIHFFGYPLVDGHGQHIEQDGPEEDGKKGRKEAANEDKKNDKYGPENDVLDCFRGRLYGIAHYIFPSLFHYNA